ncbi:MAG: hypothetical protein R3F20_01355 [Planctomycetota bacterium]
MDREEGVGVRLAGGEAADDQLDRRRQQGRQRRREGAAPRAQPRRIPVADDVVRGDLVPGESRFHAVELTAHRRRFVS